VVGTPEFDYENIKVGRGNEFVFDVKVEVKPTFELGGYKGLPIEQEEVEVWPEEVDGEIKRMAEQHAEFEDAPEDHACGDQDVAEGPLRFAIDGEQIHEEEKGMLMLLEGRVLGASAKLDKGFLEGARTGEKRTAKAVLDDHFKVESARGKEAEVEFEVSRIRRKSVPQLDDELARKIGLKDLADLREKVSQQLREGLAERTEQKVRKELVDRVIANTPFDLPKRLCESYGERLTHSREEMLAMYGIGQGESDRADKLLKESAQDAERELRRFFILDAISKKEGLEVSEEEVDEEVVKQARQRKMRAAELFDKLEEEGGLEQIKHDLLGKKAIDLVVEQAEVKVVPRKKAGEKGDEEGAEEAQAGTKAEPGETPEVTAAAEEADGGGNDGGIEKSDSV
jgi:trigger factor